MFQTIVQQIHREPLGYSSQRVLDYCTVDSQGVAGYSSQRFPDYCSVEIHRESLGYSSQQALDYCPLDIHRESLGYSSQHCSRLLSSRYSQGVADYCSQRFLDYCPVEIYRESLGFFSQRILDYCRVDSQGAAGLFFSTGSRLLSSRFTGSRRVILLSGFQTIVQQIHRESLGYSSQRVLDYCQVDSQGVAGLFCSTGSRLLSSRFTGSRWVILLNGFQTIFQQIQRKSLGYSSQRVPDCCPVDIHRESLCYSSQRVLDYCSVEIHRESLGYSSQQALDYCPLDIHRESLGYSSQHCSRLLSSRYSQGVADYCSQRFLDYCPVEIYRESLGFFSQRILDYCRVDSQGAAGLFFSTGSRLLSSRFTGSRRVILLSGFQTIVQQIHRESLGYSSQRVLDYCQVDSQGVAGLFCSTGSRLLSSRFTGSRWVILLNGFQTIFQQIQRKSLGYSSQRVPDCCPVDIHRESLCYSSQRVLDYCPVDSKVVAGLSFSKGSRLLSSRYSQGVAGLFFSTGCRLLSSRYPQ